MIIVTLTGYTCSGKSTLEAALRERGFKSIMSTTTRQPRENEVQGTHYNFISEAEFQTQSALGNFVEQVVFDSYRYGVHKDQLPKDKDTNVVIVCEPQGASQIRKFFSNTKHRVMTVYMDIPRDLALLRLLKRREMSDEAKTNRILTMSDVEFKWKDQMLGSWLMPYDISTEEQVRLLTDQWMPVFQKPVFGA